MDTVAHLLRLLQHFRKNTDDGRPDHGLGVSVDAPDQGHEEEGIHKSHDEISGSGGGETGKYHMSGMEPVSQQAVAHLPNAVGKEIYHADKPCLGPGKHLLLDHGCHGGREIQPSDIGGKVGQPAQEEQIECHFTAFKLVKSFHERYPFFSFFVLQYTPERKKEKWIYHHFKVDISTWVYRIGIAAGTEGV